jgi:hypothetical protein
MTARTASCSCGQLQLVASGEPVRISVCHCLACQRRTGSVFGQQARFPAGAVVIRGISTAYVRTGDSGTRLTYHFCPRCGSTVYYQSEEQPQLIAVPVGAFADSTFPAPRVSVYENRKHEWVTMPSGIERE